MYSTLKEYYNVNYCGPISVSPTILERILSKVLQFITKRRFFAAFSEYNLSRFAKRYEEHKTFSDIDFFNGFTPWVKTSPKNPYICWNDCVFYDYVRIFHRQSAFFSKDLQRIIAREKAWLHQAHAIIFRSATFANSAIARYDLPPKKVYVVPNFGDIDPPLHDSFSGKPYIAFISTDFEGKGGFLAIEAFRKTKQLYPNAKLIVVGPYPEQIRGIEGVEVVGKLNKKNAKELEKYKTILSEVCCLIHPTQKDTNPAVILEAAYFGCPSVCPNRFAIPEYVEHGVSGFLFSESAKDKDIAKYMLFCLKMNQNYWEMRRETRRRSLENFGLERFRGQVLEALEDIEKNLEVM